jgi:hypothetical protein
VINNIPSNYANTIAPFAPMGRAPVSQETTDLKSSTFRPTEQLAESGRAQNRRFPDERPNDDVERDRVEAGVKNTATDAASNNEAAANASIEKEQQQKEREQVGELAARDREVRAHEQAHAAVAGQYAGTTTYSYERGPDGVSYAVGGEVSIDTSPIPGDPEATLRKAQQLQRAANAPADPSSQDARVAAQSVQMEQQARIELSKQQAEKAELRTESTSKSDAQVVEDRLVQNDSRATSEAEREKQQLADEEARLQDDQERFEAEQRQLDQRQARAEFFNENTRRNIDINRRLIEIGVVSSGTSVGKLLNQTV